MSSNTSRVSLHTVEKLSKMLAELISTRLQRWTRLLITVRCDTDTGILVAEGPIESRTAWSRELRNSAAISRVLAWSVSRAFVLLRTSIRSGVFREGKNNSAFLRRRYMRMKSTS